MRRITVLLTALVLALGALAGTAVASGGSGGGGGGGGGGADTSTGGNAGGGGGGGGTTASCSPVVNYATSSGYVPYGAGTAAVWVNYTLKGCGGGGSYTISLVETDVSGATAPYVRVLNPQVSGRSVAYVFDNEPLPNDTTYQVTFT